MRHQVSLQGGTLEPDSQVSYSWKKHGRWNSIQARITGTPNRIEKDSEEEFITEHYWGYSSRKRGGCIEYPVARSSWKVWQVSQCSLDCDIESVYGKDFVEALTHPPTSAFVGEGSSVAVGRGLKLESPGIAFHRPRLFPV